MTRGKLKAALSSKNEKDYENTVAYAKKVLTKEWTDDLLPSFELDFLKAQGKWEQVFTIYEQQKSNNELSNGKINAISWDVYKNCEDQKIISKCMDWMKTLTDKEPKYAYLDTHAFLAFKKGDVEQTKIIAEKAISAAKEEGKEAKKLKELLEKL